MKKTYPDADAALAGLLFDGMTIMSGGFGLCGIPEKLIAALVSEHQAELLYPPRELDTVFLAKVKIGQTAELAAFAEVIGLDDELFMPLGVTLHEERHLVEKALLGDEVIASGEPRAN